MLDELGLELRFHDFFPLYVKKVNLLGYESNLPTKKQDDITATKNIFGGFASVTTLCSMKIGHCGCTEKLVGQTIVWFGISKAPGGIELIFDVLAVQKTVSIRTMPGMPTTPTKALEA